MPKLDLSIATGDYDRIRPLIDGTVAIDGVAPVFMTLEPEEIFFRYYLRFDSDWKNATSDGKLPGISGTYGKAGWGGRPVNGHDGWSARGSFGLASSAKRRS